MRTRLSLLGSRAVVALAALAVPVAVLATPSSSEAEPQEARGGPGSWTRITFGPITNTTEPGLYRTDDGVLHVVHRQQNVMDADLVFTTISPTGELTGSGVVVPSWTSLTADPKIVAAPGGGMRAVFAGIRSTDPLDPKHTGQMFSAVADSAGTTWLLQSPALTDSEYALDSYGTGATTLADDTPVVAFPLNDTLTWNEDGAADSTADFGDCCLYQVSLARDGSEVWSSFAANGSDAAHAGLFVKRLLPSESAITKVPQSSEGTDTLTPMQSTALAARPGGGTYLAYCIGYPTCDKVGLWKVGTSAVKKIPGSAGARDIAISTGPGGRLWVAWTTYDEVKVVHTSTTGTTFGAIRTVKPPKAVSDLYGVSLAGSNGSADVIINSGSALYHQQVLRGLRLAASPTSWKHTTKQKVTFTVTDAGQAVKGAKVRAAGSSCTTAPSGSCSLTFPASAKARKVTATATRAGYGAGTVTLRVR